MKERLTLFYTGLRTCVPLLRSTRRRDDYKLLNTYILNIARQDSIEGIVLQAAHFLREMLDQQFFALALYDHECSGSVDIWMNGGRDRLELIRKIQEKIGPPSLPCSLRYFDSPLDEPAGIPDGLRSADLKTYPVLTGKTQATLHLAHRGQLPYRHAQLLGDVVKALAAAIARVLYVKKLENAALIDPLTHCYNRRALDVYITHDIASVERYAAELSLIMFDLDHFKQINDAHGHHAGDTVLRAVAQSVLSTIRKSDYLTRYGGEEFVLVLPATGFSKAIELAERLRKKIEQLHLSVDGHAVPVTASFGVAFYRKGSGLQDLLRRADEMLYEAKRQGRNRTRPDLRVFCAPGRSGPQPGQLLH